MRHGKYIGPQPELRGCGALIMSAPGLGSQWVRVQFDRVKAQEARRLMFGWHVMRRRHFRFDRSRSWSHFRAIMRADKIERARLQAAVMCAPFEPGTQIEIGADLYYMVAEGLRKFNGAEAELRVGAYAPPLPARFQR